MDPKVLKTVTLKKTREINLYRRHPWVFSGALDENNIYPDDGELVYVCDYNNQRLGFGHYHNGSIAVKMLNFGDQDYSEEFWKNRLHDAYQLRLKLALSEKQTNCFRWVHGEGDSLPGLIIDVYHTIVVIQCHTIGMYRQIELIAHTIQILFQEQLSCIIDKSKETLPPEFADNVQNRVLYGEYSDFCCLENGVKFKVDYLSGQKTGLFLDQRENRLLLSQYADDKILLNAFCYSGAFSIYALCSGAKTVHSVDVSEKALQQLQQNLNLNDLSDRDHKSFCIQVNDYLSQMPNDFYNLIILDPPAFAKSLAKKHNAVQAYKRINLMAMKKIKPGGLLFTFSCSQVVDELLFYNTIVSAGIESHRNIRVLHKLTQGPDHPVNLFHPEGRYLKGLVLAIGARKE